MVTSSKRKKISCVVFSRKLRVAAPKLFAQGSQMLRPPLSIDQQNQQQVANCLIQYYYLDYYLHYSLSYSSIMVWNRCKIFCFSDFRCFLLFSFHCISIISRLESENCVNKVFVFMFYQVFRILSCKCTIWPSEWRKRFFT